MIKIQNIYYMLSYAFRVLKGKEYVKCATEEFENTAELMAAILSKGLSIQIKRGLIRAYIEVVEPLSSLRGKIDVTESVKAQIFIKQQLICTYDEFSANCYMNQMIKTTVELLLQQDISKARKKELRHLMLYFKDIDTLNMNQINWALRFNQNNQTYQLLINICWLIIKGLLQVDRQGKLKMQRFLDEQQMHRLYEKFILEYYRKEFPILKVTSSQIAWNLDDEENHLLPMMRSDIILSYEEKTLIIDAKYYAHTLQSYFNGKTIYSNHLYHTYVKNLDVRQTGDVSGMLLYAKPEEDILSNNGYRMSGNKISVKTLDLNCDFNEIANQLNNIVKSHFKLS
ncbi:MAG: 5-methylcytosine-specific restriction endonuclease system specificity protein McrC [Turicibacter sp.]|nr:5-methylcytosine-specific restriction endonuclease system specificity protein McrC [Turicibacter sp.]